ncbi:MAG: hypothetical protein H0U28_06715, partial [Nocardioidaceae bacterium]|nr:hypothetical protein [Nocardioidaceae bacterium]
VLWAYLRDLCQTPGFGDTVNQRHVKNHYYQVQSDVNPSKIVPVGPVLDWDAPHGREDLGGSPFGGGSAPTTQSNLSSYRVAPETD